MAHIIHPEIPDFLEEDLKAKVITIEYLDGDDKLQRVEVINALQARIGFVPHIVVAKPGDPAWDIPPQVIATIPLERIVTIAADTRPEKNVPSVTYWLKEGHGAFGQRELLRLKLPG